MALCAVSFRIDHSTGVYTYDERYSSFVERLDRFQPWDETTSLALVNSTETADSLADKLYFESHFDASRDLMVVIDIETGSGVTRGPVKYPATLEARLRRLTRK